MSRPLKLTLTAILTLILPSNGWPAPPPPLEPLPWNENQTPDSLIQAFMDQYQLPGLSIALTKNEKLVWRKAYGFANLETQEPLTPNHRFRIASLSKPITSSAILKWVEQGRLSLEDPIWGPSGILQDDYPAPATAHSLNQITLRHLLEHTAGGYSWDNQSDDNTSDPMFTYPDQSQSQLIQTILQERPLENEIPGFQYRYSNFGYCLLGRILEKLSGQPYETHVQEMMLNPLGIFKMQIAGDTLEEKQPDEVHYYHPSDPTAPYRMPVRRMDSHGGWLASPTDLVRWLVHLDGFPSKKDLLRPETLQLMTEPSAANPSYAKGWSVNSANNWWHTGSLPGTGALLVRTQSGYCWAVLVNSRASGTFFRDLDRLPWNVLQSVKEWPSLDLFE